MGGTQSEWNMGMVYAGEILRWAQNDMAEVSEGLTVVCGGG